MVKAAAQMFLAKLSAGNRQHCIAVHIRCAQERSQPWRLQPPAVIEKTFVRSEFYCTAVRLQLNLNMNMSVYSFSLSEILKDESNEIDLAGPTFPSLKVLLDLPPASTPDARERYQKLVHGILSSCLLNIDEMRYVLYSLVTRRQTKKNR